MKPYHLAFLGILALVCAGCSGCSTSFVTPKTPAQIVFDSKTSYAVALVVAVKYKQLPSCVIANHPPICSDPAMVKQVLDADNIAAPILNAAELAVRTPGFGNDTLQTITTGAQAAVSVFKSLTDNLKTN